MNFVDVTVGGFAATVVLTTIVAGSQSMGISRMDLSFMLGTMVTPDRDRARIYGFALHMLNGWAFAFVYALLFEQFRRATWWEGSIFGFFHGLFMLVVLLPLLPGIHPRMVSDFAGPEPTRELEPPGFLGLNYGYRTPLVSILAHIVYGAIIGAFYSLHG